LEEPVLQTFETAQRRGRSHPKSSTSHPTPNSNTTRNTSQQGPNGRGQGENGDSIQEEFQTPKGTTNGGKEGQTAKAREEAKITKQTAERLAQQEKDLKVTEEELEQHQQAALENQANDHCAASKAPLVCKEEQKRKLADANKACTKQRAENSRQNLDGKKRNV
jgi:hypothetical protein